MPSQAPHRTRSTHSPKAEAGRFRFGEDGAHGSATTLDELASLVATVDGDILKAHLRAGDISRWVHEVVADDELRSRLRSIERWVRNEPGTSRTQAREAVISAVESR